MWTQYDMKYAPTATPVVDEKGEVHGGFIPLELPDENGVMFDNADAVAYGLASFFAKLNGKGLSHMAYLVRHKHPNRATKRRINHHIRRGKPIPAGLYVMGMVGAHS